jgi:hypothetical protein
MPDDDLTAAGLAESVRELAEENARLRAALAYVRRWGDECDQWKHWHPSLKNKVYDALGVPRA